MPSEFLETKRVIRAFMKHPLFVYGGWTIVTVLSILVEVFSYQCFR